MALLLTATKLTALLSGVALGLGLPAIEATAKGLELPATAQQAVFLLGLLLLFFAPVLLFVVGAAHLSIRSRDMARAIYWSSLGQVAMRALVWLVGCGIGFAVLAAARVALPEPHAAA